MEAVTRKKTGVTRRGLRGGYRARRRGRTGNRALWGLRPIRRTSCGTDLSHTDERVCRADQTKHTDLGRSHRTASSPVVLMVVLRNVILHPVQLGTAGSDMALFQLSLVGPQCRCSRLDMIFWACAAHMVRRLCCRRAVSVSTGFFPEPLYSGKCDRSGHRSRGLQSGRHRPSPPLLALGRGR